MKLRVLLLALFLTLSGSVVVLSQVSIAPVFVFMNDNNSFGSFIVMNGSNQNQEIAVDFVFGYSSTDGAGNGFMVYDDSTAYKQFAATDWVRAFPRNFVLEPGQRQTVRITARPPQGLSDGLYWTRIRTASNPQAPSIDELAVEGVRTQITFRFEQVTALFYKKGSINTGIRLNNIRGERTDNGFSALVDVYRSGNSPFFGSASITLRDASNRVVAENSFPVSIYFDGTRRFTIPVELSTGDYTVDVRFESQRGDMPSQDIIQTAPVSQSARVILP
jgi:P pilus assembly chaperone PapD